jgi:hypothetical protein
MRPSILLSLLAALALLLGGCSSDDGARILYDRAEQLQKQGKYQEAMEKLQEIQERYPRSDLAPVARQELQSLRDLVTAGQRYPTDQAVALVRRTGRAVEKFKVDEGRLPRGLDELVPGWLERLEEDPWDRPVRYETTAAGYRLACYGADGKPGGRGQNQDVIVENGEFVLGPEGPSS